MVKEERDKKRDNFEGLNISRSSFRMKAPRRGAL
jgi:hypothetical protein